MFRALRSGPLTLHLIDPDNLALSRVAAGHGVSNVASQRSLAKTPGLVYAVRMRESGRNARGELEDGLLYGILRRDWLQLYEPAAVEGIG